MAFKHTSVLLEETVDGLKVKPDGIYVDGRHPIKRLRGESYNNQEQLL